MDPRVEELARIVTDHSTGITRGDVVVLQGAPQTRPLLLAIYRRAVRKGAHVTLNVQIGQDRLFLREAEDSLLEALNPIDEAIFSRVTVLVNLLGPENTKSLAGIDPSRMERWGRLMEPYALRLSSGEVRLLVCAYPATSLAQEAGMDQEDFADFLYGATNIDYEDLRRRGERVRAIMDEAEDVHLTGPFTDLHLRLDHRPGTLTWGKTTLPDGELFYAPVEDATEGYITFDHPAMLQGREVNRIGLTFRGGRVVEATADSGEMFLLKVLESDPGAKVLGEFGIGLNDGISALTKNMLFDERMSGTVHLALGRPEPGTGGKNLSAIHWDMVKDMRNGGTISVNGRVIMKDGLVTA